MLRIICFLNIIVGALSCALADLAPPPPSKGFKRVPLEHVLKLDKEIPGYRFFTFEQYGLNSEIKIKDNLKLSTDKGVVVPAADSPSVWMGVVAVPEKIVEGQKSTENLAKLMSRANNDDLPAGMVIYSSRGTSEDVKENDPRTKVETVITISADDKAGVKFTAAQEPAPASKKAGGESSALPHSGTMFAGMAMSLALVTSGLWWFRRK